MSEIEKYAVDLVIEGIESAVSDDMYHGANAASGGQLACQPALVVRSEPDAFLAWYRSLKQEVR